MIQVNFLLNSNVFLVDRMKAFYYQNNEFFCEGVPIVEIAEKVGTPFYVYSQNRMLANFQAWKEAFGNRPHLICYALKANSNPFIVKLFAEKGSGADVVSGGELWLAQKMGIPPDRIIYSGVGKTDQEIAQAIQAGILALNVESMEEISAVEKIASQLKKKIRVSIRINPQLDPNTHPYIVTGSKESKFGIPLGHVEKACQAVSTASHLELVGLHCHIGSMISEIHPFQQASEVLLKLSEKLHTQGVALDFLDIGGGLGVDYHSMVAYEADLPQKSAFPTPQTLLDTLLPIFSKFPGRILVEPGRSLTADAGVLITRVLFSKWGVDQNFVIVDAGMNDLIRPTLYDAFHQIVPIRIRSGPLMSVHVVGPLCESGDFFAYDRPLPPLRRNDLLAIMGTGAYGFVLSSNYNGRPRPPEVLVHGDTFSIIRNRETWEEIWKI